jgi:hypothetical protein
VPGRSRQALRSRLSRFLQLLYLFRQGRKSCVRTYQPSFPSSLLFARSRRATSLRLCVSPAMQVSQALPRGGAEFDFSVFIPYIKASLRSRIISANILLPFGSFSAILNTACGIPVYSFKYTIISIFFKNLIYSTSEHRKISI